MTDTLNQETGTPKVWDVVILGSGAAGLTLALQLSHRLRIALIAKGPLHEGSTYYAQGGVSVVMDPEDSLARHVEDTMIAGAGLCHKAVVEQFVAEGPSAIRWLIDQGVAFTRSKKPDGTLEYHLNREGGHSCRRVIHTADATGRSIESVLLSHIKKRGNVTCFEHHHAIDLIHSQSLGVKESRCLGVYALDAKEDTVKTFPAHYTILATGGAGRVYRYTSNPSIATGDGIAMAWRAGCRVANLEFIQFHPTLLYHPQGQPFLITEAMRGEGARLLLPDGSPFMHRFDTRGELASRDIVARAIDHEMKRLNLDCVYLDIHHRSAGFITHHFPTIHQRCLELGIDITQHPIPVAPAAHYTCGGVKVDLKGQTDLNRLYAIGEVACTGFHGANRMASNSLLECLVSAQKVVSEIDKLKPNTWDYPEIPPWKDPSDDGDSNELGVIAHNREELHQFMWNYVGIVRTTKRLERAQRRINLLRQEVDRHFTGIKTHATLIELRNLITVAQLIIRASLARKESRGAHYSLDYPRPSEDHPPQDTVLTPLPAHRQKTQSS